MLPFKKGAPGAARGGARAEPPPGSRVPAAANLRPFARFPPLGDAARAGEPRGKNACAGGMQLEASRGTRLVRGRGATMKQRMVRLHEIEGRTLTDLGLVLALIAVV